MENKTTIIRMTDAYLHQSFYKSIENLQIIDCRDIEGTRCYLDDFAKEEITRRIKDCPVDGIHFIDSGNYHYLSLLWLIKIKEDFNLVLFDHHPDDQPPSFGTITSCGSWVLEARKTLPNLKNVYTFGVGDMPDPKLLPTDLPLYISIDKDVLSTQFAITDWDQGEMSLDEMKDLLSTIMAAHEIIGIDICGDSSEYTENGVLVNNQTNQHLFDFLSNFF